MSSYVTRVEATGLHGRYDLAINLLPGINVIYGRNAAGKTTLLHILANILNGTFSRFAYLAFREIRVTTDQGHVISVRRSPSPDTEDETVVIFHNEEQLVEYSVNAVQSRFNTHAGTVSDDPDLEELERARKLIDRFPVGPAAYFPAFRAVIEAVAADDTPGKPMGSVTRHRQVRLTRAARRLFGPFVPPITYPSPLEIGQELSRRLQSAAYIVADESKEILSRAFLDVFAALPYADTTSSETPEEILEQIKRLLEELERTEVAGSVGRHEDVYRSLSDVIPVLTKGNLSGTAASVLSVYRKSLAQRIKVQRNIYSPIEQYTEAVNDFLEGKRLVVDSSRVRSDGRLVTVRFLDGTEVSLRALSSGE
ncbi:MAG: hypothetical protein K0R39_4566, partial [Symbiobacteriaceae bacterium]|nr:hypothetical protein [Symbiobacteriaceae bacterium]